MGTDIAALLMSTGLWAYVLLFALAAGESGAFVGLVIPGESLVLAAGVLAEQGTLDFGFAAVAVIVGAVVGDNIGYTLGRGLGDRGNDGRLSRAWSPERRRRSEEFFKRRGPGAIFWGRFIGFLRPLVPFAAGAARMPYRSFLLFNIAGAFVWGAGTLLIGFLIGENAEHALRSMSLGTGVVVVAGVALALFIRRRRKHVERIANPPVHLLFGDQKLGRSQRPQRLDHNDEAPPIRRLPV